MNVAPFSDGSPAASQWPIPPHHFFDYEVHPQPGYAGTYFYHSHVGFQSVTASGPLIVDEAPNTTVPYNYDEERTLYLQDFYPKTDEQIETGVTSANFSGSGDTKTLLVNGQSRVATNATGTCRLASINVEPDKVYRLRLIGAMAISFLSLALQDHEFAIIAADGKYTQPQNTTFLQIAPGQRFDVLLHTKSLQELNGTENYFFQLTSLDTSEPFFAVLSYSKTTSPTTLTTVPSNPPLPIPSTVNSWLDYTLAPLHPDPSFPSLTSVTRRITLRFHTLITQTSDTPHRETYLDGTTATNGVPWTASFPSTPYLVSIYENTYSPEAASARSLSVNNSGLDPVTRTFPAQRSEVLEIVLQNEGATDGSLDVHPFHAHGGHYFDLGSGRGTYNATANEERLRQAGTVPAKRDTTIVYADSAGNGTDATTPGAPDGGWRAWRLRVDDVGVWMVHCHNLQHMLMGNDLSSFPFQLANCSSH
ncbi:MAG: hypothetical protein M1819_003028 [Sarea resinae]|nr:MAG: hypothetical protein M1819_003028 [Sarea resinae]